jgi:HAMP domain-containing protein
VALDAWLLGGQQGERPRCAVADLDERIADRKAEFGASGSAHVRLLAERADHDERNRKRMLADMKEEIEAAASEYRALVDQLEHTRRDLLELRATEKRTRTAEARSGGVPAGVASGSRPIEGVGIAVAACVGLAESGPFNRPQTELVHAVLSRWPLKGPLAPL